MTSLGGEECQAVVVLVGVGVGRARRVEERQRQRLRALEPVVREGQADVEVVRIVLVTDLAEELAQASRIVLGPAVVVLDMAGRIGVELAASATQLDRCLVRAERTACDVHRRPRVLRAALGVDRKRPAQGVEAVGRHRPRQQLDARDGRARKQVPVHDVAESLVDPHAILKHRQAFRRAEQRRRGEAAEIERLLERVALPGADIDTACLGPEELRQRTPARTRDIGAAEDLDVGRNVAQRNAEAGQRRRADDLDAGELEGFRRIVGVCGDLKRGCGDEPERTRDGSDVHLQQRIRHRSLPHFLIRSVLKWVASARERRSFRAFAGHRPESIRRLASRVSNPYAKRPGISATEFCHRFRPSIPDIDFSHHADAISRAPLRAYVPIPRADTPRRPAPCLDPRLRCRRPGGVRPVGRIRPGEPRLDHRHRDASRRAHLRRSRVGRFDRCVGDSQRPAPGEPVGVAGAGSRHLRGQPAELRTGPADQLARLRRARGLRRAWRAALPGRHSGDDARRPGPDGKLQPAVRTAHRSAARAVLGAVRQRFRRRDLGIHRGSAGRAAGNDHRRRGQQWPVDAGCEARGNGARRGLCRCRQRVPHRWLPRALAGTPRSHERQARLRRRAVDTRHADRQLAVPARNPGSAGTHARAMERQPAWRRPFRPPVRHAQDDQPGPGRRRRRPQLQRRAAIARRCLRRQAADPPVPRLFGVAAGLRGRRTGRRSRLRRTGRTPRLARQRAFASADADAGRRRRPSARAAHGLRQCQRGDGRPAAQRGRHRHQPRFLRAGRVGVRTALDRDGRRAQQQPAITSRSTTTSPPPTRTTAAARATTTRVPCWAWSCTHPTA